MHDFTGAGVYYAAATTEANSCRNRQVYVSSGGNSAGQGAVYLSQFAAHVTILIRDESLAATMSAYLIEQIQVIPNITVRNFTEVVNATGTNHLTQRDNRTATTEDVVADTLFIFIGARPFTDWLPAEVFKSPQGFVLTGREVQLHPDFRQRWQAACEPQLLETSVPGQHLRGGRCARRRYGPR